ncbi:hypothetical protein ITJ86_08715 [Winogradskyella sp. F6397]|uniref:Uncharacterized protein n=1 Tax=Winogradskyella marina TaxID=2785530 RepID=A0ABS0EHW1_9FLAO|nr:MULTISPECIES: hypothetical protein [Winogradskyella]MBF8149979.1 hypothetical protein [Winogradskyella marina]
MSLIVLIPFFIFFAIFIFYSKADLYAHEHDASINREIGNFQSNFEDLQNLNIENNYYLNNNHIYSDK